ncbi:prohead protease/major capsid protein fusion protein [Rhizobium mayense]|uniref:prohead protease/major capsid protein fusion protein n=1 Tax=Rhizobium mayense TaxID=1312184 RepID=UPI00398C70DC
MPQQIDAMQTRADRRLSSFNAEARTVDIVLATESEVKRRSWEDGLYIEILNVTKAAIDTSRMDSLALVDQHDVFTGMSARLGWVVAGSLRFENGTAIVTAKISRNPGGEALFRDLEDGHVFGASVGYRIDAFEKTEAPAGGLPTIRATRWTPLELSIVSIPADPAATTRALETERETAMPQIIDNERQEQQRQAPNNIINERTRVKELRGIARLSGIDDAVLDRAIDDGMSVTAFRDHVLETIVERQAQNPTFPHSAMSGQDNSERDARIEALAARMSGEKPSERARQFMSWTLEQHARASLEAAGVDARSLSRDEVFGGRQRYYAPHTTSDFPLLLQSAGERLLMAQYEAAQSPIKQRLCRSTTMSDFRKAQKIKVGDIDTLAPLNEAGEIKATTRGEAGESYGLSTFARIFALSRNAMINDDLSGLADWSRAAGRAAAETENQIVVNLLLSNPKVGEDNIALFHASHNNLSAAGGALSVDSLSDARKAMRKQKAFGNKLPAGVQPAYLLVGPELETKGEQILAALAAATTNDVNPFANRLELLVEPRIEDASWYVFASPTNAAVMEWAHLSSAPGPQIAYREGFETLGTDFRVHLDFGAGVIDFRGAYKNPGQ